jgi:hypothetical protein
MSVKGDVSWAKLPHVAPLETEARELLLNGLGDCYIQSDLHLIRVDGLGQCRAL